MSTLQQQYYERICNGRQLSGFDREAAVTVAALRARVTEAHDEILVNGIEMDGRMNPACEVELKASAELRGWVKARPDLFGQEASTAGATQLRQFKPRVVGGES